MSETTVIARFRDLDDARAAAHALADAGIPAGDVTIAAPGAAGREGFFLGRVVLLIVAWSVPGGVAGAGLGLALALSGVGPAGTTGAIVQGVSWMIIGHLLAGMWAGYVLLSDRTQREIRADSEAPFQVSVRCRNRVDEDLARRVLGAPGD